MVAQPRFADLPLRAFMIVATLLIAGCAGAEAEHPWIRLGPDSPHRIVEFSGADAGQVVIAVEPMISRDEALTLGRLIQSQAPAGATVNVRLYNDLATARGWRTAPANLYVEHLLVVISTSSVTGEPEVRWVRPDSLDIIPGTAPASPGTAIPGPQDSATAVSLDSAAPGPVSP